MNTDSKDNNEIIKTTNLTQTNSVARKKELCDICKGIGFTKSEPIYVNNIKYVPCKPCGTIRNPYDICDTCHGSGNKDDYY